GLLPGTSNYFRGSDPAQWVTGVPAYGQVAYQDVYPGIDLVYHGSAGHHLEYDFTVHPGADPAAVRLTFPDAAGLDLDPQGNLRLHTAAGDLVHGAPALYQEAGGVRQPVAGRYALRPGGQVGFQAGAYDPTRPL